MRSLLGGFCVCLVLFDLEGCFCFFEASYGLYMSRSKYIQQRTIRRRPTS